MGAIPIRGGAWELARLRVSVGSVSGCYSKGNPRVGAKGYLRCTARVRLVGRQSVGYIALSAGYDVQH